MGTNRGVRGGGNIRSARFYRDSYFADEYELESAEESELETAARMRADDVEARRTPPQRTMHNQWSNDANAVAKGGDKRVES